MDDIATAQALLPLFNAWSSADHAGADVATVRKLEGDLWAKVAEHGPLVATDPVLIGRWIIKTLGGRFDPASGVIRCNRDDD